MTTYSLTATGTRADYLPNQPAKLLDVPDTDMSGNVCSTPGGIAQSARLGTQMLCKNPDGSQSWYTWDGQSSLNGQPLLKAVGP